MSFYTGCWNLRTPWNLFPLEASRAQHLVKWLCVCCEGAVIVQWVCCGFAVPVSVMWVCCACAVHVLWVWCEWDVNMLWVWCEYATSECAIEVSFMRDSLSTYSWLTRHSFNSLILIGDSLSAHSRRSGRALRTRQLKVPKLDSHKPEIRTRLMCFLLYFSPVWLTN